MTSVRENLEELRAKAADCELLAQLAADGVVRQECRTRAAELRKRIEETEAAHRTQAA